MLMLSVEENSTVHHAEQRIPMMKHCGGTFIRQNCPDLNPIENLKRLKLMLTDAFLSV